MVARTTTPSSHEPLIGSNIGAEVPLAGLSFVAGSVTKTLDYLACDPEPGPAKMESAMERGIKIISADEWRAIVRIRRLSDTFGGGSDLGG